MSHIHNLSGSTKYLLKGTKPVNGKRFETLDEMQHFYDHYDEILAGTKTAVAKREDEKIAGCTRDEIRLDAKLKAGIARQTLAVDNEIATLKIQRAAAPGFFSRAGFSVKYWFAVALRDHHIHSPYAGLTVRLDNVRYDKMQHINNKQATIERECAAVTGSYNFLKANESFLVGAHGEEYVIRELSQLPDEFHVINDINLRFGQTIHWRQYNEYIKTCQIDHVVAGPTGIFLLETKNWKRADIGIKSDKLVHQVKRANLALWYYTKDYYWTKQDRPKIRNVVVSVNGSNSGRHLDQYIDIVPPGRICNYIRNRQPVLAGEDVEKFVGIIAR